MHCGDLRSFPTLTLFLMTVVEDDVRVFCLASQLSELILGITIRSRKTGRRSLLKNRAMKADNTPR